MCATIVITPDASADQRMLFAKSTERTPNEAHAVTALPRRAWPPHRTLRCTEIELPQAPRTHSALLAKPYWTWGADMGVNARGLAIGFEALPTRPPAQGEPGLSGPDLVRLALERAETAEQAVEVITQLLEQHGPSDAGACATRGCNTAFAIADPATAWLVETAGRRWAAKRLSGYLALAGTPSIGTDFERSSRDWIVEPIAPDWREPASAFDSARAFVAPGANLPCREASYASRARERLQQLNAAPALADLFGILRDHGKAPDWRPDDLEQPATLCRHAAPSPQRHGQTTGALLAALHADEASPCFVTGTAAPCVAPLRPAWVDALPTGFGVEPARMADTRALFWRHEQLHRAALADLPGTLGRIAAERDAFDAHTLEQTAALAADPATRRRARATARCDEADAMIARWATALPEQARTNDAYAAFWRALDHDCGLTHRPSAADLARPRG